MTERSATEPALVAAQDPEPEEHHDDYDDDADSAVGDDLASSTNSMTASIMEYRNVRGRTFHSERHETNYFAPNDNQQLQSMDITHHYLGMLTDEKLFLTPQKGEDMEKVLDIGTGTGIWAIDFADQYPHVEITGTDLSPMQPVWVPPNVKFEIDDCTMVPWTWPDNTFDLVHARYLVGAIKDYDAFFNEAYRVCKPGGWVQTAEPEVDFRSDDNTVPEDSAMKTFWERLYHEATQKMDVSFEILTEDLQRKGMEQAGFEEITVKEFKLPVGGWPADPKLSEVGQYVQLTLLNDVEGYTMMLWNALMGEDTPGYQVALAKLRKEVKDRRIHGYFRARYVYGRKPATA
ncbi:S-adenosyl-L-methionine-dependent methyltransferase [Xylariomycetidae sp. FL0641]|nr:S-adenosyl-L-methionine-dependent methyltransferase [Xylariomycetidae sp. FL0641]